MMTLRPFLRLWRRHFWRPALGIVLAIVTLLASTGLLTLSGWFLAASSLAGAAASIALTICCLRRAYAARPSYAPSRAILSGWSAMTAPSGYCSICASLPSVACCRWRGGRRALSSGRPA